MYTFIVNPNAKTGLGYQVWSSLEAILKEKSVNYQVFFHKISKARHTPRTETHSGKRGKNSYCIRWRRYDQ